MEISIKEVRSRNETRVKVLLQDFQPLFYPCLFITSNLLSRSPNTQQRFLQDLIIFINYLNAQKIDLEARLKVRPIAKYLDDAELSRFAQHAGWKKSVLDKIYSGVSVIPSGYEYVGAEQARSRMSNARAYLSFLYELLGDKQSSESAINWMSKRIAQKVKTAQPAWRRTTSEPKGLTSEQRDVLLLKLVPTSEDNPWPKSYSLRVRNQVIIFLALELGMRRSEILGLKLEDIDFEKNRISVLHRPNDPHDTRIDAPLIKTNERVLPVSVALMGMVAYYIKNCRCSLSARRHPYLLVTHARREGRPLAIKSIDSIFLRVEAAFPVLKGITAHTLRHDSVYQTLKLISDSMKDQAIEDKHERAQRILTYKFGWSDISEMPKLYGAKYWHEQAESFMLKRMEGLQSSAEKK